MWHRILIICFIVFMPAMALAQDEMPAAEEPAVVEVPQSAEPEAMEELADPQTEEPADEDLLPGTPEEVTPISAPVAAPMELIIQSEQIGWNQFRFRPASRLGAGEFQYEWDFGDGNVSAERVVEHAFSKPGRYSVTLRLVEPDGTPHVANMIVRVGFFHLANWRLWVILGLLALIIILASVTAGVTESIVSDDDESSPVKPIVPGTGEHDELALEPLSESSGDFDSFAATGEESKALGNDLALLESIRDEEKEKPSPLAVDEFKGSDEESEEITVAALAPTDEEVVKKPAKKPAKKKSTKKRPGKKRTIKVKSVT